MESSQCVETSLLVRVEIQLLASTAAFISYKLPSLGEVWGSRGEN